MATDGGSRFVIVGNIRVRVIKGNLSDQQVDVIVNSNGSDLDLSKGRASKALLNAAGFGIQLECQQRYPNGIQDGTIAITSGGQLSCKAIYHGALAKYSSKQDEQILQNLIDASLKQAESDGHQTIAFPALGAGKLGYPAATVAEIMLTCVKNITPQSLQEVLVVIFKKDHDLFKTFLTVAKTYIPSQADVHKPTAQPQVSKTVPQNSPKICKPEVEIIVGALNNVQADVLVCSGPKDLQLSNGGLSEALLRIAGRQMQDELNNNYPNGVEYGDISVSGGYQLPCKFVYHGALPKWGTNQPDPSSTLEKFMEKCLETANNHSTRSIAFPTLGVGSLHYPSDQTAKLMVKAIRDFTTKHSRMNIRKISIVVYNGSHDWSKVQNEFMSELNGGPSRVTAVPGTPATSSLTRQSCSGQVGGIPVTVLVGSLVEQKVNVIVNSVAHDLAMTSGTSAAIGSAAGPWLSQELAQNYPQGINHGDIAVSKGHNLSSNEVYHGTLLPWYSKRSGSTKLPDELLEDFVLGCLEKANKSGYTSIAIPALGTGFHKFPADVAAAKIVSSVEKFSKQRQQQSISDIRIVLYGGSTDLPKLETAFRDEINQVNSSGKTSAVASVPNKPKNFQSVPQRGTKAYLDYKYREALRSPPYWTKYTSDKKLKGWNLQVKAGKFHLENIDQVTHGSIENALKKTLGNAQIVSIQRLENVELFLKYGEECQRLFRKASVEGNFTSLDKIPQSHGPVKAMRSLDHSMTKHTHSEINEYYFFHATKSHYVDVICSQGLDSRLAASGRLGAGVYGAEVASKSHQYAGCDSKNRYPMFLVRMSLGDIYLTNSGGNYKRPPCKICTNPVCATHQEIHDSVMANGGAFSDREFVVYDRNQSYPEYLIWYTC
ncbi:protein mono-ADP-ribosyltransferase PARP15-like isoform X2 [Saccostrea cucullata]|uniref:protein mono-ADP-ribosyltransferase PARP15-like isoform X2 n=1 Tax=Saccostrea cuccullata TaxID=36930 RepID=UPI002ED0733F